MRRIVGLAVFALLLSLGVVAPSQAATFTIKPVAYTLVAPATESASGLIARVVLPSGSNCPSLITYAGGANVASTPMTVRPVPRNTGSAFTPVVVCEVAVPVGVDGRGLIVTGTNTDLLVPTAINAVSDIGIIGDTGCRVGKKHTQDCNSATAWPLASFANAMSGANPDVVIHLGDYMYITSTCGVKEAEDCGAFMPPPANAPFVGNAGQIMDNVLIPMTPLFNTAPLLMMRGNHEGCTGDGNAYFYFFDAHFGTSNSCSPASAGKHAKTPRTLQPTWWADMPLVSGGNLRAVVVDSTYGWDTAVSPWAKKLHPGFVAAQAAVKPGSQNWLLVHRPVFGITSKSIANNFSKTNTAWISRDVTDASKGELNGFNAIFSGHMHLAQSVQVPGQPGQLVLGNGGTSLDPKKGYVKPKSGPMPPYKTASSWWTKVKFGFGVATWNPTGSWNVAIQGESGELGGCTLTGSSVQCSNPLG